MPTSPGASRRGRLRIPSDSIQAAVLSPEPRSASFATQSSSETQIPTAGAKQKTPSPKSWIVERVYGNSPDLSQTVAKAVRCLLRDAHPNGAGYHSDENVLPEAGGVDRPSTVASSHAEESRGAQTGDSPDVA